jgi:hypothetical protein
VFEAVTSRAGRRGFRKLLSGQLLAVIGVVLTAAFLFGCGGGDDTTSGSDEALPPNVVTDSDIDAQPSGSPEQALLEWWQSYQFSDSEQVVERTSNGTLDDVGEKNLSALVKAQGQGLQGIEVLGSEESGNTASVRVGLLQFTPEKQGEPPPDEPTSSTPDTFEMKKEGGEWKFAATDYLAPKVESFVQAQEQQTTTTSKETTTTTGG